MSCDNKGGYYIFGRYSCNYTMTCHRLIRVDSNGNKLWTRDYPNFQPTNYGGLRLIQSPDSLPLLYGIISPSEETHLVKLDENGSILWRKDLPLWSGVINSTPKEIVLIAPSRLGGNTILRLDANGNILSQTSPPYIPLDDFVIETDGITSTDGFNQTAFKMDFNGQILWSYKFDSDFFLTAVFDRLVKLKTQVIFSVILIS